MLLEGANARDLRVQQYQFQQHVLILLLSGRSPLLVHDAGLGTLHTWETVCQGVCVFALSPDSQVQSAAAGVPVSLQLRLAV